MHILGIYFLVALLAGLIAYLGNNMGRKIGRKKMSVLGLRPRHTSNFITTLTGSVIAVATLSLFAIFSEPVRELLKGTRDLEKRVMELTDHRQQLEVKVKELESKVYQGRMVYGVGEPIVLGTLNPSLGPQSLHAQILVTLSAANAQAIVENNTIASQKGEAKLDGKTKLLQCDDATLNEFSRQLENQKGVVGIRVLAARNCLFHDRVPVILEAMPVKLLFHQGETVTSRKLEPNHPQMLVKWYDFLEAMRTAALSKGTIQIHDSLGGGVSSQDLARIASEIDRLKGPGKLVAVARRDLYTTSPLDVRIMVVTSRRK